MSNKKKPSIVPFGGFIVKNRLIATGRVLSRYQEAFSPADSIFTTFRKSVSNFITKELPSIEVNLWVNGQPYTAITDDEGYFHFDIHPSVSNSVTSSISIRYTLPHVSEYTIEDEIKIISHDSPKIIVVDIDDTILQTEVLSRLKWKLLINSLFINPYRRRIIPGSVTFLNRLSNDILPIFYLSNSPYNMYAYIQQFLFHFNFPNGVMLLRDIGRQTFRRQPMEKKNKYRQITRLMSLLDQSLFIFIGDSAEDDFNLYYSFYTLYPSRVDHIYIRKSGNISNEAVISDFTSKKPNIPLTLVDTF